ncbi:MAG: iron-containing alcohol dehydrogenase [Clostridia bacterium]|nr:iron-containing alcohol dehydrogenase [Clostridia bacterium]
MVHSNAELGRVLRKENITSVLVVTDAGLVKNGIVSLLEEVLRENGVPYKVYDKTQPNPTVHNVEEALSVYKRNHCNCLIAIGGGSSMDCAKAVGARVAYPRKMVGRMKGVMRILRKLPTVIAIPTTAGTGSEVTPVSIITDSEKCHKYALMSFPLIPHYAVLDARFTYSLPPHGLANTVIMPYILEAYGKSVYKKLYQLGMVTGVCNGEDSYREGAGKFIAAIKRLNKAMGIPDTITGIKKEDIAVMAKHAEKEANPLYPVPRLMTRKELETYYYKIADWSESYDK